MKYTHKGGSHLIARRQMRVELIEGSVEGILMHKDAPVERMNQANRQVLRISRRKFIPIHLLLSDFLQILASVDASNASN